jgi:MoaA/NifB/PqqE/SkfB family radical SAM enzyme
MYGFLNNKLARLLKTPLYIILFVSDRCWMRCLHCWYNESWKSSNLGDSLLSLEELELVADSLGSVSFLSLTGGEAFLRKDLVEITQAFAGKDKLRRYQIPTAGYEPQLIASTTEKLLKSNRGIPLRVDVSLDGTEATHDYIRNVKGAYRQAVKCLAELNRLKRKYSYFDVGVITTISNFNQDEVNDIANVVEKVNPEGEWMVNITRGTPRDSLALSVDPDKYFTAHTIIKQRIQKKPYHGHRGHLTATWLTAKNAVRRKVIKRILDNRYKGGCCAAGSLGGVIYGDGRVTPCELIDRPFGQLRNVQYDLRKLWRSADADSIRNEIWQSRCQCTQECFLSLSLIIQPLYLLDLIKEEARLLRHRYQGKGRA